MRILPKPPSNWAAFMLWFDPQGLLDARQQGIIRQLYQVLRQSGYQLKVHRQESLQRPEKRARVE